MSSSIIERLEALEVAVKNLEQHTDSTEGVALGVKSGLRELRAEIFGEKSGEAAWSPPGVPANPALPLVLPPPHSDVWNFANELARRIAPSRTKAPTEPEENTLVKSDWKQTADLGPVRARQFKIDPAKIVAKIKKARKAAPKKVGRKTRAPRAK